MTRQLKFSLLLLAALVMVGCASVPTTPATTNAPSPIHGSNVVLPDFVYGYPMHF